jgi:hypothetical protein
MLSTLVGLLMTLGLGGNAEVVYAQEPVEIERKVVLIEVQASLLPELKKICACESGDGTIGSERQFNSDGTVLQGRVDKDDTGMCQINLRYHGESAEKMGLDVRTEQGNIKYANHLYETQGSKPWSASQKCWNK